MLVVWLLPRREVTVKGLPNLRDRFVQYGIKVSFWGSRTLKIVIYVFENHPQKRRFGWLTITLLWVENVN